MTGEQSYRLGESRITVCDDVLLRWERHAAIGMARSGRCFLWEDVLIIGKQSHEEDGFLIGEFHDKLRKLPPWDRTRYYCYAGDLLDTATGQPLTEESLDQWSRSNSLLALTSPGSRRLGHFQITITADGQILWQTYGDINRFICGHCDIESGILVIGPQVKDEPGSDKQKFLMSLANLPPWKETAAWCRGSVLRLCGDVKTEEPGVFEGLRERWQPRAVFDDSPPPPRKRPKAPHEQLLKQAHTIQYKDIVQEFFLSGWRAINREWQRVQAGKFRLNLKWSNWIVALIVIALLLSLAAAFYIAEEGVHWSHAFKKHHHKHHEH